MRMELSKLDGKVYREHRLEAMLAWIDTRGKPSAREAFLGLAATLSEEAYRLSVICITKFNEQDVFSN